MNGITIRDYGRPEDQVPTERWTTDEMQDLFQVHSFSAPFVYVTRKRDGVRGSLEFSHSPRFYFNFRVSNKP